MLLCKITVIAWELTLLLKASPSVFRLQGGLCEFLFFLLGKHVAIHNYSFDNIYIDCHADTPHWILLDLLLRLFLTRQQNNNLPIQQCTNV